MSKKLIEAEWLPKNEKSYKGIFIVGKNNKGKTLFLKEYSTDENFIDIKILEEEFIESYRDLTKKGWFDYSIQNLDDIAKLISHDINLKYEEPIDIEFISKMTVFNCFKISENDSEFKPLSSTGYMSLFLIISYLNFKKEVFEKNSFCFFDEVDMYLDILNKAKLIKILVELLPNTKFVISTHSPFTIVQSKDFLIYNIETSEISYTNDIGNLEGVIKKMLNTYNSEYNISQVFKELSKIYKSLLIDIKSPYSDSNIENLLGHMDESKFTYKELILKSAIKNLLEKSEVN